MPEHRPEKALTLISIIISLTAFIFLLCILALLSGQNIFDVLAGPVFLTFSPNHNYCGIGGIRKISILGYFYMSFFAAAVVIVLYVARLRLSNDRIFLKKMFAVSLVTFAVIFIFIQLIQQTNYMKKRVLNIYWNKSPPEKLSALIGGKFFEYILFCKTNLPGRHSGMLVTDFDLKATLEPYILSFYLYPQIDLDADKNKDCAILFNKSEALQSVPDGYVIKAVFDAKNLIAIREEKVR